MAGGSGGGAAAPAFIDIGANLLDGMFRGRYHGKPKHKADIEAVLERAWASGVERILVTAGTLKEARSALAFCEAHDPEGTRLFLTVGVHPTNGLEFEPKERVAALKALGKRQAAAREAGDENWKRVDGSPEEPGMDEIEDEETAARADKHVEDLARLVETAKGRVVALGEMGLDYDRLFFCPRGVQLRHFRRQLALAKRLHLPLFLHDRATGGEFAATVRSHGSGEDGAVAVHGVVHSFTGSDEELDELMGLGFDIGLNGCSLKTADNVATALRVPLSRLHLETDAPWCGIRPTHAGHSHIETTWSAVKPEKHEPDDGLTVKGRCEPCHIIQVAQVLAGAHSAASTSSE